MKVHEYQARDILARFGVPVPAGRVASSAGEAGSIAEDLGGRVVVKAQIHAGGRGKGGGVKLADSAKAAEEAAGQILGMQLKTPQTGPDGQKVKSVLVAEQTDIDRELYLSVLIDGFRQRPIVMASSEGGVEIEAVAESNPDAIHRVEVDPAVGLQPYQARQLAFALGLDGELLKPAVQLMTSLYDAFIETDASLAEINPLVVTKDGRVVALDAKMNFDDNALYRRKEIADLRDKDEEDPLEVEAEELGIQNYVKLDGNIGCVVNGAGLAMATMDAIKLAGGDPANFLDIGTVNDVNRVVNAFKVIGKDEGVKAILINIFGGMARVDVIAQGVVDAHSQMDVGVPVVVRLEGTNLEEGEKILKDSGLPVRRAKDLGEAAQMAVEAAAGR